MTMQPAAVVPADAELWATGYLRTFLASRAEAYAASVWVGRDKPPTNKPRTIAVRRDGGPIVGVLDHPRLTFRIWADGDDDASDLARLVAGAIKVSPGHGPVLAVTNIFGPSPIPDSSQAQYMVNAELVLRCAVL